MIERTTVFSTRSVGQPPCISCMTAAGGMGWSRDFVNRSPINGWYVTVGVLDQAPPAPIWAASPSWPFETDPPADMVPLSE